MIVLRANRESIFKAAHEAIGNFARQLPGRPRAFWRHQQRSPICNWITGSSALMFRSFKNVSEPWPRDVVLGSEQERAKRCQNKLYGRMTKQIEQIDLWLPLLVGACAGLFTI